MNDNRTVYVAGHYLGEGRWELLGVFDEAAAAEAACTDPDHFFGYVPANTRLPDESIEWQVEYPLEHA